MFSRSIRVFLTPSPRLSICFSCSTISDSPPRGEGKRPRVGERDEKSKKRRETGLAAHFSSLKLNVDAGVREDVCAVDAADEAWAWPLLRSNGQCLAVLAPPVNMSLSVQQSEIWLLSTQSALQSAAAEQVGICATIGVALSAVHTSRSERTSGTNVSGCARTPPRNADSGVSAVYAFTLDHLGSSMQQFALPAEPAIDKPNTESGPVTAFNVSARAKVTDEAGLRSVDATLVMPDALGISLSTQQLKLLVDNSSAVHQRRGGKKTSRRAKAHGEAKKKEVFSG